jgi:hypothetical protein
MELNGKMNHYLLKQRISDLTFSRLHTHGAPSTVFVLYWHHSSDLNWFWEASLNIRLLANCIWIHAGLVSLGKLCTATERFEKAAAGGCRFWYLDLPIYNSWSGPMGLDKGPLREFDFRVTDELTKYEAWSIRWSSSTPVHEYWETELRPKLVPILPATAERLGRPTIPSSLDGLGHLWPFGEPGDGVPNPR